MNIVATQYSLKYMSFEIYLSGCKGPHCANCHNPELWNFDNDKNIDIYSIVDKINNSGLVKNVWILGGEPLDQDLSLLKQMLDVLSLTNKDIWLFTRYDINEVPDNIKFICDYIKCGRYIEELKSEDNIQYRINLASSNQYIWRNDKGY